MNRNTQIEPKEETQKNTEGYIGRERKRKR